MTYTITIPDVPPSRVCRVFTINRVPLSLNRMLNLHWSKKRKLREMWEWEIKAAHGAGRQPKELGHVKVTITIHNSREYDRDNAWGACKIIFDALKTTGFLFDDRREFLEANIEQRFAPRGKGYTTIEIEAGVA